MKRTHSQNDEQIAASFDENMEFVQFENIVSGYLNMPQLAFDVVGIDYCKELIFFWGRIWLACFHFHCYEICEANAVHLFT